jgi:hypothetical protein
MDSEPAIWTRKGMSIVPANDAARALVAGLTEGQEYLAGWPFRKPRSLKQLRLWWSLCHLLAEHDLFPTQEAAHVATKIATGHFSIVVAPDTRKQVLVADSIAFESMPQERFQGFFNAALKVVTERWLKGVDMAELRQAAYDRIDGRG